MRTVVAWHVDAATYHRQTAHCDMCRHSVETCEEETSSRQVEQSEQLCAHNYNNPPGSIQYP